MTKTFNRFTRSDCCMLTIIQIKWVQIKTSASSTGLLQDLTDFGEYTLNYIEIYMALNLFDIDLNPVF